MKLAKLIRKRTAADVIVAAQAELSNIADAAATRAQAIEEEVSYLISRGRIERAEQRNASRAIEALKGMED